MPHITVRELLTRQLRSLGADGLIIDPKIKHMWPEQCDCTTGHDFLSCDGMGLFCVAAKRGLDGELQPMEVKSKLTSTAYFPRYLKEDPK